MAWTITLLPNVYSFSLADIARPKIDIFWLSGVTQQNLREFD